MTSPPPSTLLLLADGRLPAGGHAHSGGLEEAVAAGRVSDAQDLAAHLRGRLSTTGRMDAALAAAAARPGAADRVNREALARCASPALRR
ncbi:MAG: urease accessory UreF family protein, partial [Acidimicrobiales bacterium]